MYTYRAQVHEVIDGDTIDINIDLGFGVSLRKQRVRLAGIDTAETRTTNKEQKSFGLIAKDYVSAYLANKTITLHSQEFKGKFGRILGNLFVEEDGVFLTDVLLEKGLAVKYSSSKEEKLNLLTEALKKYNTKEN